MAGKTIDCRFFLLGSCRNGDACPFRHSEGVQASQEACAEFAQTGQCSDSACGKRHGEAPRRATKPPSEVPCRNEENGGTCTRPNCIFKHAKAKATSSGGGLNAGAKVFVPRAKAAAGMEWTAESTAKPAAKPAQQQTFGNMEWTPDTAAKPAAQQTFGNLEWTPATGAGTSATGSSAASTVGRPPHPQSIWPSRAAVQQTSAFAPKTAGGPTWPSINSQQASVASPRPAMRQADSSMVAGGSIGVFGPGAPRPVVRAASQRANTATQLAAGTSDGLKQIQTIYDILGISEEKPEDAAEKHSRLNHRSRMFARKESPVDYSMANSPVSNVCYASEFSAYALGDTGSAPAASIGTPDMAVDPPASSTAAEHSLPDDRPGVSAERASVPASAATEVAADSPGSTAPEPEVVSEPSTPVVAASGPRKALRARGITIGNSTKGGGEETGLPKVLSFQEIMARKRRKQAEAAAAQGASGAEEDVRDKAPPTTPSKRRAAAPEPSGKRGRPAPASAPATKNYIAMFEQELEDMSAGLSGPLENSPSSDRISRAALDDTYCILQKSLR